MVSIKKVTIFSLPIKLNYIAFLTLEKPAIFGIIFYVAVALWCAEFSMLTRIFVVANPNLWSDAKVSVFAVSIHYFRVCSAGYQDHK
mgnify:FL=1